MTNTRKVVTSFAGVALAIATAAVVLLAFRSFDQIETAAAARRDTYTQIVRAGTLLAEVLDAETGQRGFLLTGDESFLEPYLRAKDKINDHLEGLSRRSNNEAVCQQVNALTPLITAKMVHLAKTIELFRSHDLTVALVNVRGNQGKLLMDSIRAKMSNLVHIQEEALAQCEADFQTDMLHLFIVIVATNLLAVMFSLLFTYLIYRETQHRLKDVVHLETQHLLKIQEDTNEQLKQANATLQVSEEKFSVTLNSIGDAVMATDADGCITLLNPLAEKLTGWTLSEAIGRPVDEVFCILDEKTHQSFPNPVRAALAHGTVQTLANHTLLIARDGSECSIADSCAPIRDRNGQVVGAVLVFRDVTARTEIETGLEKTRKELEVLKRSADEVSEFAESIINTVREPLLSLDQDLRVVTASRSFYQYFKVSPEETIGQLIYNLGNKQWDIPKLRELLETILPLKATFDNYEVEHNFTTIGRRIMLLNARQIQRTSGKEKIILLAIEDITERREIENGLEKTRKELEVIKLSEDAAREYAESIINTVRESLIALDQDLRVVSVSRSFYEVFKVNPEDTVGQLIYDLGNKQWDIPKLRELLETILPQKASFDNYEVAHNFANIGRRIMLLNARQIQRGQGKERIILLAIEDITERRTIETGLEKAHLELKALTIELERAARAKSEFLANMSHELRTPLNSINGFSEVLFDGTFGPLNEKQKQYVNNVLTSGKHLLLLINQILDMAKVEAGKMKLELSCVPMKSLLNEISMLVADMVNKKQLTLTVEIADDLPAISADELKVKEIIYNLLSNAVKFTPEGGRMGIRAMRTNSDIEIVVWDTGVGIAPENMEKVFEGFFRVDTPYSRLTEGTGLGLPLSRKLVELHGGRLSIESEGLSCGTSVRFSLPVRSPGGVT
jgi:two-component system CheB/CheR fusion protein